MKSCNLSVFALIINLLCSVNAKDKYLEKVNVHHMVQRACTSVQMTLNQQKAKTRCTAIKTMVKLNPDIGYTYVPDTALIPRCRGYCPNNISCMPTKKKMTSVFVNRLRIDSDRPTCYEVFLEEHVDCKCLCDVKKHHCNAKQVYSEDECACNCINMEYKEKCDSMPQRRWNSDTCSCMCDIPEEDCSTGLMWDQEACRCVSISRNMNSLE